jgi:very-short-patch-repair endonuclease
MLPTSRRAYGLALREKLPQYKFRRQHPISKHVVDFVCRAYDLAIELDGGQHDERREADAARSAELAKHGLHVIRFWNNDVLANLDGVVETIRLALRLPTSPRPSPP